MMAPVTAAPTPSGSPSQKADATPKTAGGTASKEDALVADGETASDGAQKQASAFAELFAQDQAPVATPDAAQITISTGELPKPDAGREPPPVVDPLIVSSAPFQPKPETGAQPAALSNATPVQPPTSPAASVARRTNVALPTLGQPLTQGAQPPKAEAASAAPQPTPIAPPVTPAGGAGNAPPPEATAPPAAAGSGALAPVAAASGARIPVRTESIPPTGIEAEPTIQEAASPKANRPVAATEAPADVPASGKPQPAAPPQRTTTDQTLAFNASGEATVAPPDRETPVRLGPAARTEIQTSSSPSLPPPIVGAAAAASANASATPEGDLLQRAAGLRLGDAPAQSGAPQQVALPVQSGSPVAQTGREAAAVAQQIAASVIRASGDRVEVRLDPPELGRVALSFQIRDDLVIAHVSADKSETSDLLRRNGDDLQRALKESGFGDVELDFSGGGEAQEGQARAKTGAENAAKTEGQPMLARAAKTGALDLRI